MTWRGAYTVLLVQLPPALTGVCAALFGFLGSALPGVGLARLGANDAIVRGGLAWAGGAGAAATFAVGLVCVWLTRGGRRPSWGAVIAAGFSASACGWAGAVWGTTLALGVWPPLPWPPLAPIVVGLALGGAVWGAREKSQITRY